MMHQTIATLFFVCVGVLYGSHASSSQEDLFPQGSRSMEEAPWTIEARTLGFGPEKP
ncbi:MAG: hypothetical protein LCH26_02605 [Proteobacteria bacterium]|nr:hypothetical protein [Pseudomonadota bacterium]